MSFKIAIVLCLTLFTDALGKHDRIVGGEVAALNEFPYQVGFKLLSLNLFFCGGALVSERHVLSAAHCFKDKQPNINDIRAFAGVTTLMFTGPLHKISRIDIHPDYTGESSQTQAWTHDISVLTLENTLTFSRSLNKVLLPIKHLNSKMEGVLAGWGKLNKNAVEPSNELKKIRMKILGSRQCKSYFRRIIQFTQFCCVHPTDDKLASCQGDSGGGLVIDGKVVGILSWIIPCAMGNPDIYTDVYEHLDFINAILHR